MHEIEPHYNWRDHYIASEDEKSPFFGRIYDEFKYSQKIYNYFIHPQWDNFGSPTLYMKILFVDYEKKFAIFEMMGEWNDCLTNDIMFLKRDVVDELTENGITKFVVVCENVLNFHGGDEDYYQEWYEDITEKGGWICFLNMLNHVETEMRDSKLHHFVNLGDYFNEVNWRALKPKLLVLAIERILEGSFEKQLP